MGEAEGWRKEGKEGRRERSAPKGMEGYGRQAKTGINSFNNKTHFWWFLTDYFLSQQTRR